MIKVFICKICESRKKEAHFTRRGFREHLKNEHSIKTELTLTNLWYSRDFDDVWKELKK